MQFIQRTSLLSSFPCLTKKAKSFGVEVTQPSHITSSELTGIGVISLLFSRDFGIKITPFGKPFIYFAGICVNSQIHAVFKNFSEITFSLLFLFSLFLFFLLLFLFFFLFSFSSLFAM
jgi:hypothetical protein